MKNFVALNGSEVTLIQAINLADATDELFRLTKGKPKAIISKTLKGRGVPGLENEPLSHIINPKPELIDELLNRDKEL